MKTLLKLNLVLIAVLVISCESKEKEVEKLKSETIAVHDEVMPKMDDIMKLKKSLREKKDSISTEGNQTIEELISSLEESDNAMMNWMRNYDPQMKDMSEDEKIDYLNDQKSSIEKVSKQMKNSISEAERYLNQ
ncbi:hypothetical protein QYS49_35090 [Marivirga salinae]|uniref:Viral A-type inclusion protein n=1 Tax=Marivirga salinarum TaxID=3059078 RepID=A0AA51NEL7_9BACT|nr:hypothetical protein [Marivirga sp. BDSF4-3]WMN12956.1 hypothetical protein QYS49_35090 [Marivirga sp. BDSF4-3]